MALTVEGRTILDVAVISLGETVDGRYVVTASTLADVLALMQAKQDGTKVLADHDAEVEDLIGRLVNPRLAEDGNSVRADLEVFESAEAGDIILESAAKMPSEFGLSINAPGVTVENEKDLRVAILSSVDFASRPAANPVGLLASIDSPAPTNNPLPDMTPDELKAMIAEAMKPYGDELAALKAKLEAMTPAAVPSAEDEAAKMSAIANAVTAQLRASLGLAEGVKLSVAPTGDAPKKEEDKPAHEKLSAILAGHVAAGKSRTEAVRLAAKEHPDLYKAAVAAGPVRF